MRILYLACSYNPLIQSDGSSADYDLYHAFLRGGATVQIVGPFVDVPSFVEKIYRKFHRLFSRRRYSKHSLAFLRLNSQEINRAIDEFSPDILFTYFSYPLVYLKTEIPIVYGIDTTLIGSQEQWPIFSQVEYQRMLNWEQNVLRRSAAVITWSKWTADILKDRYGIKEERISYFPIPASLPDSCIPKQLEIRGTPLAPLNLLLVGRDKERKGVSLAVELVNKLNKIGLVTNLRIVGLDGQNTEYVRYYGLYDKSIDSELRDYIGHYQWSHFLIHPAKFEAAGIVPSEAAAFGVPSITNASGGLATTVKDKVSGIVLPMNSPVDNYVNAIRYYIEHPDEYMQLRVTTRKRYEQELNWSVTGKKIIEIVQRVVRERE